RNECRVHLLSQGPISLAVFTSTPANANATLRVIACLREIHPVVSENVTFHLVFPVRLTADEPDVQTQAFEEKLPCRSVLAAVAAAQNARTNYARRDVQYPHNLLRNVGRRAARTEFVFVVDADFLPDPGMREDFLRFAKRERLFSLEAARQKIAYVVPAFEAREGVAVPRNKSELLDLWDGGLIRPFYAAISSLTQGPTDYQRWRRLPPTEGIAVAYEIQWQYMYEPFVIVRNSAPLFDERFRQYGWDRVSQVRLPALFLSLWFSEGTSGKCFQGVLPGSTSRKFFQESQETPDSKQHTKNANEDSAEATNDVTTDTTPVITCRLARRRRGIFFLRHPRDSRHTPRRHGKFSRNYFAESKQTNKQV
ncbi:unnamed protein product, partial [Darwinula stevensoni]